MALEIPPDVIVFPEYSIPWQCLQHLHEALNTPDTTVFAGTHTIATHPDALRTYRSLGIEQQSIRRLAKRAALATLPILRADRTKLVSKTSRSPYEKTEVTETIEASLPTRAPLRLPHGEGWLRVLPLLCSEALQLFNVPRNYDLTIVLSAEAAPDRFDGFVERELSNRHPTIYCNDGRYGGTGIFSLVDNRTANWQQKFVKSLPAGEEGFIVADLNLDATTIQKGTAAPQEPIQLIRLGSITYEDMDGPLALSRGIREARAIDDAVARAQHLSSLLSSDAGLELQEKRIGYLADLAKRGTDSNDLWDTIGADLLVPQQSLRSLEASLSSLCSGELQSHLPSSTSPDSAKMLVDFLARCQTAIKAMPGTPDTISVVQPRPVAAIVDRDEESAAVVRFVDHPHQRMCQLLGREQIGKTVVLEKALAQIGPGRSHVVRMSDASSAEYLLASIVVGNSPLEPKRRFVLDDLIERLPGALRRYRIVVVEDAHTMLQGGAFRNGDLERAFRHVVTLAAEVKCKIIVLSRRGLPDDIVDAPQSQKVWIQGMEGARSADGVTYLDTQLRRVGISPRDVDESVKRMIVNTLGGHPVALALAADAMFQDGIHDAYEQIQRHDGFWKDYVDRIAQSLELNEEDVEALSFLSGCRAAIGREVIQQCTTAPFQPIGRRLISLCVIDVASEDRVWLSRLCALQWRFQDLPEASRRKLHEKAALWHEARARRKNDLDSMIEAEYHAALANIHIQSPTGLADAHIGSARSLFSEQRFIEAKIVIDRVLSVTRTRDVIRLSALIDARCHDFDSALGKVRTVLSEDPFDSWLLDQVAKAALDENRIDILEQLIATARTVGMNDERIAYTEGRMYLRQRRYRDAIRAFETARDLAKYNPWPFFHLGRTYLRLGELDPAIDTLEEGIEFYEQRRCRNARALHAIRGLLAQCYLWNNNDEAAEQLLGLVQQHGEVNPEIARAIAMLSLKREGVKQAHEAYERLRGSGMPRRDDRCQFHIYFDMFLRSIGDLLGASEQFAHAISAVSSNLFAKRCLAETLYDLAVRATHEGAWSDEAGPAISFGRRCGAIVRQILDVSPNNTRALSLQEALFHEFQIQV